MKYVIINAPAGYRDTIAAVLDGSDIKEIWWEPPTETSFSVRFVTKTSPDDPLMDKLQQALGGTDNASIHVMNIDSSYPNPEPLAVTPTLSREELHKIAADGARSDPLFLLLVMLSTIVASIGLIQNNVAVIIGAMVIAPLLGPNLSFALASALGDYSLARQAIMTFFKGISLALLVAVCVGLVWQDYEMNAELEDRTRVGLEHAVLAFASGAAAVLSMTSGAYSVLVGVMVAVALVPPLATAGLLLGLGQYDAGLSALLLLSINVAAINLAAHMTLGLSGIAPRNLLAAIHAKRRLSGFAVGWLVILGLLVWLITTLNA